MRKHTHLHQHIHLQKDAQANAHMHRDKRTHPHVQTHKNTHTHLKQRHILGSQPIDEMAESISDWPDRNWRYKSQVLDKGWTGQNAQFDWQGQESCVWQRLDWAKSTIWLTGWSWTTCGPYGLYKVPMGSIYGPYGLLYKVPVGPIYCPYGLYIWSLWALYKIGWREWTNW